MAQIPLVFNQLNEFCRNCNTFSTVENHVSFFTKLAVFSLLPTLNFHIFEISPLFTPYNVSKCEKDVNEF